MAEPTVADVLKVVLDEFKALRDEINQRATYCHTLLNINVVASGTLAGFLLSNPEQSGLLLILPIVGPVLGLLWIDHSYAIRSIGDYIDTELKPAVSRAVPGHPELLRWEAYLDEHERRRKARRFVPLYGPILVVFCAVPSFALYLYWSGNEIGMNGKGVLWCSGLALTVAFFLFWTSLLLAPWMQGRGARTS